MAELIRTRLGVHWIPAHRGTIGGRSDREWLGLWRPKFVKIVTDNETVPYIEDAPADALIIVRHYPLSELGHDRGFARGLERVSAYEDYLPQEGSGRDALVRGPGAFVTVIDEDVYLRRGLQSRPEDVAREHATICHRIAQWCEGRGVPRTRLVFEGLNEPMLWSVEPPDLVARYYAAFLKALHGYGLRGVCGNFGVGWPGNGGVQDAPVDWAPFKVMIDAMLPGDYLGLHEYWNMSGPGENWRWWAGRYEQCPYNVPILITETGIDGGVAGRPGAAWGDLPGQMTERAKRYVDELFWYWRKCAADGRIAAVFPFTYDRGSDTWINFDIRNEDLLTELIQRTDSAPEPVRPPLVVPPPATTDVLLAMLRQALGAKLVDLRAKLPRHPTLRYATRPSSRVKDIIVHHTAAAASQPWEAVARYHISERVQGGVKEGPWPGIAYHYGITPDGTVSILNGLDVVSYHAGNANATSAAIVFAGNFQAGDAPTAAAMASYRKLVGVLCDFLGRPLRVRGHRDVGDTACPGNALYAELFQPAEPDAPEPPDLAAVLRVAADTQELAVNPAAALLQRMWADGRSPTSPEFTLDFGGAVYVCQTARKPGEGRVIYYVRQGDWGNVKTL